MTSNPYQVWGPLVPPMLGRMALVRRIETRWEREVPDHVSVVGPAHYGKSVLLRHLASVHRTGSTCYLTTAHVDLRRATPESDAAFKRRLAEKVKEALHPVRPQLAKWLDIDDVNVHELLDLVFKELDDESKRLLVVLDGFDYALAGTGLTPELWGQLRELASQASLILLTGSRRPLRKLGRTGETRSSPFWNIFHYEPVRVHALDETDWPAFLQPLRDIGCEFEEPALKEIANWTGGVPVLVCALLQNLWEQHRGVRVSKTLIDRIAEMLLQDPSELIGPLWDDCHQELRSDLGTLSKDDIPLNDLSDGRRSVIVDRGFGRISRNSMRGSCRLMQRYAKGQAPAIADVNRVFGTQPGFNQHIRTVLELHLQQVTTSNVDEELMQLVGNAVRDITPRPQDALTWARGIVERALMLIWDTELPDRMIPRAWLDEWNRNGDYSDDNDSKLPYGSSGQCHVLRLLTRSDRTARCKYVTKTTCLLVDHLQSVGNFGSHLSNYVGRKITIGFAASVVLSAIAVVECLTFESEHTGKRLDPL